MLLGHSIHGYELVPGAVAARKQVQSGVLPSTLEFVTLSGWAGQSGDIGRAILLHMTGSVILKENEKEFNRQ